MSAPANRIELRIVILFALNERICVIIIYPCGFGVAMRTSVIKEI